MPLDKKLQKYTKKAFMFMKSTNSYIDLSNPEMVKEINKKNPSLLYFLYRENKEKEKAIQVLNQARTSSLAIAQIKEIIHTYIYFQDFEGALNYISTYNGEVPAIIPLECLIRIHLEDKNSKTIMDAVFSHVKNGLLVFYDQALVKIFVDYHLEFTDKEASKFTELQEIILKKYHDQLTYNQARYLYRVMPNKLPFLQKMIQSNPFIKRKYYFEYANAYGIHREDIMRILTVKYRTWAMAIALLYGWVDESARTAFDSHIGAPPRLLNGEGDWCNDYKTIVSFSKRHVTDEIHSSKS